MSKAILILDEMPKDCLDCELLNGYDNSCVGGKIGYDAIYEDRIKPKWCPLKRIPQKKYDGLNFFEWKMYKNQGWNDCVDEILGGKE